jgi:hypothetical protein
MVYPLLICTIVAQLSLPLGFSVAPEADRRLVSIAPDHTVAARAEAADGTGRVRAFRWNRSGVRAQFGALPVRTSPDPGNAGAPKGIGEIVAVPSGALVSATEAWSGAYSGISYEVQRWAGATTRRWPLPACIRSGGESDQHANAVDARGRVALTLDITGSGSFSVHDDPPQYAPYAYVVDRGRCAALGRAVVLGVRDRWAAGYRLYLDGKLAPTVIASQARRTVAVRWRDGRLTELGEGVAYAVADDGLAVGASALFDPYDSRQAPHAVVWDARGSRIAIDRGALRSVAYDVAGDGTAVGMLQSADGKHYAFVWHAGRLERLDDLPHPRGWRFESAYSIAPDGTIAGTGTHDGAPVVFTWRR